MDYRETRNFTRMLLRRILYENLTSLALVKNGFLVLLGGGNGRLVVDIGEGTTGRIRRNASDAIRGGLIKKKGSAPSRLPDGVGGTPRGHRWMSVKRSDRDGKTSWNRFQSK